MSKTYTRPKTTFGKTAKGSRTLPDQSLSIRQILERFTRGVPVDVKRQEGINMPDNNELDYERMSRMDFDQKVDQALEMRANARAKFAEMSAENDDRKAKEAEAKAAKLKAIAEKKRKDEAAKGG